MNRLPMLINLFDEGKGLDEKHIRETVTRMVENQEFNGDLTGTIRIEMQEDGKYHIIMNRVNSFIMKKYPHKAVEDKQIGWVVLT